MPLQFQFLGSVAYEKALHLMQDLREKRQKNLIDDQILFLEHPPVITMGKRKSFEDLKCTLEELDLKGIAFSETDRGGKLTYHGPGQLVIYFIVDIERRNLSIQKMVWMVEEGIRLFLKDAGIEATRDERNPGLWVKNSKIASIGLHVQKGVTTHGVALNLAPDLSAFDLMIPCGLPGVGVTSVQKIKGKSLSVKQASKKLELIYQKQFLTQFSKPPKAFSN